MMNLDPKMLAEKFSFLPPEIVKHSQECPSSFDSKDNRSAEVELNVHNVTECMRTKSFMMENLLAKSPTICSQRYILGDPRLQFANIKFVQLIV
uniref:Uncharacterized protein n=1 Tax=Romanomermis culicivorax TaxID=13658 RepID=A0A915IRD2_ROMCU